MGLNKHMLLEEHELEQELEWLLGEGDEWDDDPPDDVDPARIEELERRLAELRKVQRDYNQFLGTMVDGKPAPSGVSPRFQDHVEAFERIQKADTET
jgi:hypothetical protein